ncbi:hypothetical protein ZWY2020_025111 [Hordeum vulgare]|nr:hypothetical protein ZWY2020_025111 [Hordeum vulgare]
MELNDPPFGQPIPLESVEYTVQAPLQDDLDDLEKLTLLSLEFTCSAEDNHVRKVIIEEMKKIRSARELVELARKIEKIINAGSTILSLLEMCVAGISRYTCEVPMPSYPIEQDNM